MTYETVTVTVPTDTVPRLLQFAADLAKPEGPQPDTDAARVDFIQTAYRGGDSEYWRPFLDYLADRPGEWVSSDVMGKRLGLSRDQIAGMLGAAGRRLGAEERLHEWFTDGPVRIYEKQYFGGKAHYRMPKDVADIIVEHVAK